jgi:hypothetical protein
MRVEIVPDFYAGINPENLQNLERVRVLTISEKCNCDPEDIKHINGGNYHSEIRVYRISNYYIFIYGNTRETFEGDQYYLWVVLIDGKAEYSFTIRSDESYAIYESQTAEKIIKSYEEDEDYYVYYHD